MRVFIKTTLILALLAVIGFGARELIFAQDTAGLLVSENDSGISSSAEREILSLLLELRSIDLNDDVFQSSVFRSFKDFGVTLESQPVGRPNPFAPIGEDVETLEDLGGFEDNEDLGLEDLDDLSDLDDLGF